MSTRSVLLAALALAVASTACQPPAQQAGPLSEEDVAAITSASQAWAEATGLTTMPACLRSRPRIWS
jgi:hypothetical protein